MPEGLFVGLDVHKKTIQVSAMNSSGEELSNYSINNTPDAIRYNLGSLPKNAKLVMESSSIWKAPYHQIRDELGLDIKLSNPYATRLIAESKKKTDKVDSKTLADLRRGDYIIECHVPSEKASQNRDLVRYRRRLVEHRTGMKNSIHGILLQNSASPPGKPFSTKWTGQIRRMDDYRINSYLSLIESINDQITKADVRIRGAVDKDKDAQLVQTIPGIGPYTALTISAEIDCIGRFIHSDKLCSYMGLVPAVRSSGNTVHYGPITKHGSSMVRWVLTEAVHSHVRYAPKSDITVFYKRLAKKRGSGKATVAAAAKMLRVIFWMLKDRREFVTNYGQELSCGTSHER